MIFIFKKEKNFMIDKENTIYKIILFLFNFINFFNNVLKN